MQYQKTHLTKSPLNDRTEQIELVYRLEPEFRLGWKSVQLITNTDRQYIRRLERDFQITATEVERFITTIDCDWNPDTQEALLQELRDLEHQERLGLVVTGIAGQRLKQQYSSGNPQA
jgi:hypothetical protein